MSKNANIDKRAKIVQNARKPKVPKEQENAKKQNS